MNDSLPVTRQWPSIRLGFLVREIDERIGAHASEVPLLSVSIHRGVLPRAEMTDRQSRAEEFATYKRVAAGDMVINRMRAFEGGAGISPVDGMVSADYAVLRAGTLLDRRYFHYLIRSRWFVGEMTARLRGIGNIDAGNVRTPRINVEDLTDIPVTLHGTHEQRTVAAYLDRETARLDALIDLKGRMLDLIEERWKARVIGSMWAQSGHATRLKYLLDESCPGSWGKDPGDDEVDVSVLRSADIDWARLTTMEGGGSVRSVSATDAIRRRFKPGDLLLEKSGGAAEASVGRAVEVSLRGDEIAIPTNFAQLLRPRTALPAGLVKYTFAAAYYRKLNQRSIKKTTIANLDLDAYLAESWVFPRDPEGMGSEIAFLDRALRERIGLSDRIAAQVALLLERREALINAAITGQLDIPGVAA